nr:serine/threonine-protein kinase EDR1-like isoform X1 [Ipomoea batatas]
MFCSGHILQTSAEDISWVPRRSHKGLIVYVSSPDENQIEKPVCVVNFVDLVGYEDSRSSISDRATLAESTRINRNMPELKNPSPTAVAHPSPQSPATAASRRSREAVLPNRSNASNLQKDASDFHSDDLDGMSGKRANLFAYSREHMSSQKAMSLPSYPHEFSSQTPQSSLALDHRANEEMVSTWNRVLESPMFQNKPLLPFEEWNIDFSELTVGIRVGIGIINRILYTSILFSLTEENGTEVAIKVFLEQDLTAENMEDFCNEISILSRLRHPNVILFLGACTKPPHLSMVTEYMEMGSLYYLIHLSGQKKKLSWRKRLRMLRDICRGLMGIHRMKIVHRDIKSANCLVNKHWTVKICDFGLSRIVTDAPMQDSTSAGTPEWMAQPLKNLFVVNLS